MKDATPRILKYFFFALLVLAGLLAHFINGNLVALVEFLVPGSALVTHLVLMAVEGLALFWLWMGVFGGRRHLLLMDGATPDEEHAFAAELERRMKDNPHIVEAGIRPEGKNDPDYLPGCLACLKKKADEEIRQNARRIFLATALSQNGRLDAIIVFVCLCRLVWRVSRIYNQRPHPREIASLYAAVGTTTFLALSLEELDITTEITTGFGEVFQAVAPAGLTASIPFAGKMLQTFTSSTLDGAANCYLALRAGIIARNAYAYGACKDLRPTRAQVFREAGAHLLEMSHTLVDRIAAALASGLAGAARSAGSRTMQAGKDLVGCLGRGRFCPVESVPAAADLAATPDEDTKNKVFPFAGADLPAAPERAPLPWSKAEAVWKTMCRPFSRSKSTIPHQVRIQTTRGRQRSSPGCDAPKTDGQNSGKASFLSRFQPKPRRGK